MIDRKIGDKMISFEITIGKRTQHLHLVSIDSRCTSGGGRGNQWLLPGLLVHR